MVTQPHGGALRNGGTNRGGRGYPDRIKKLAQQALLPRVRILAHFADGVAVQQQEDAEGNREFVLQSPTPRERIAAIEALHKIGNGEQVSVSDVRRRMKAQLRAIHTREMWDRDELLAVLDEVWA